MKCPHKELLSVYFDGELPSPWKEKMELHVSGCASCARALEAYKSLSLKPSDADVAAVNSARERVWRTLETGGAVPAATGAAPAAFTRRMPGTGAIWRRRVSIPLPAAAAVVVLFIALALFLILRAPGAGTAETPGMAIASETDFESPGIIPAADMASVLQYLSGRDGGDTLILRLPDSRNFVNYGEPAIIRAADYSRQAPGHQRQDQQRQGRHRRERPEQQMPGNNTQDWRKP